MSHKRQKSFSFFCCFWEKPKRQKRDSHEQKSIRNSSINSISIKNKTDTSSNIPTKEIKEKKEIKRHNSYIPQPKSKKDKNDNYFNFKSNITASRVKDNNTYTISNMNDIKNSDMNSNKTFRTYNVSNKGNKNINKLIDNYRNNSQNKSNSHFKDNTLVSVINNRNGQKKFSAIGYVVDNNDGSFQIIIIKIFDKCIHQIGQNPKNYKDFAVSPSLKYSDTESLFYEHAQKGGN